MSQYDPPGTPHPPGPPHPDPDRLLARRGVRWTIISVVVSTVLAVPGLYFQAAQGHGTSGGGSGGSTVGAISGGGGSGGSSPGPTDSTDSGSSGSSGSGGSGNGGSGNGGTETNSTDTASTDTASTDAGDGLTSAERDLRDSLNSEQWQRDSCEHWTAPDSIAALRCTVSTASGTTKAMVGTYPTRSKVQEVYQRYTAQYTEGDCDTQQNVRGSWHEDNTSNPTGDMACYWAGTRYVIFCTYYDRPALYEVTGTDPAALTQWWHSMHPVFTD